MDDDILDKLDGDVSTTTDNVYLNASSINGLVTDHDELLLERDEHATSKDDPQSAITMDHLSSNSVSTKALNTICKLLPVVDLVGVTPLAPTNGVCGHVWTFITSSQVPS
ncbi:unnamed protein product [Sphenostylis stenocarpa]|uniref:Uncharacterized protein n=1 Tax=Sphenostylis stenocarpa TaxID=92480 RepID=A0AA86S314_9FABA|nr:unnamed protein product [Sphenostylis stenocarpa]